MFGVEGLEFGVQGLGSGVKGLRFRVQGLGFKIRVEGSEFRAQGSGFRAQGLQGYLAHIKKNPIGPYSSPMPRALQKSLGVVVFL